MAKVQGPLMSLDASGTVASTITFAKWKGRNYVRSRVIPANPQTSQQMSVRANFAGLVALYKANTATIQTNFLTLAKQRSISAFNAFVGYNQTRAAQGFFAANSTTPTNVAPTSNVSSLAAAVGGKYVKLTWVDSTDANAWGVQVYRKLGADPSGLSSELVGFIARGAQVFEDGPLASGTWHYSVKSVSINGGATTLDTAVTATIT